MQRLLFGVIFLLVSTADAALLHSSNPAFVAGKQGTGIYAAGHYFAGNDYIAAKNYLGSWDGAYTPRRGTNLALLNARAEAGASWDSWRVVALYRAEALVESSRDITDIVYYNKQRIHAPAGRPFDGHLRFEGFEADGIRLDKGFALSHRDGMKVSLGIGLSLLRGRWVRIGRVDGTAFSTETGYTYNATLEDSKFNATYPFIRNATPIGHGHALDFGALAVWDNGARLELAANDLFAQMRWDNMPHTIETANSATLARDPSGYIYYNPIISGVNDLNRRTITQELAPKLSGQFSYPISNVEISGGASWTQGYWFPDAGLAYRINPNWKTALDYDFRFNTVGLGIAHKAFYLNLRSEDFSLNKARAYGVACGLNVSF